MNAGQKAVKYIGIFIGVLLAVCIIGSLAWLGLGALRFLTGGDRETGGFAQDITGNITSLSIDSGYGSLRLAEGDGWRVEAENVGDSFTCRVEDGQLSVRSEDFSLWDFLRLGHDTPSITVYMPAGQLESIRLASGTGELTAEAPLQADTVRLDGGAGSITISDVTTGFLQADMGVGKIYIQSGDVDGLKLDGGVGTLDFTGRLEGDAVIDGGVGEVFLHLDGAAEDYNYQVNGGIGEVLVNGEQLPDGRTENPGAGRTIKIDGGVGTVSVDFPE